MKTFPSLAGFEPTRQTLHTYSKAVTAVPRAVLASHSKWWHIALSVQPNGLISKPLPLPNDESLQILLNLQTHEIQLITNAGVQQAVSMQTGLSGKEMGNRIITAVTTLGLTTKVDKTRFATDTPTHYNPIEAEKFLAALQLAQQVFSEHSQAIPGETGPVNFWSHHFDLSTEWFGSRLIQAEEHGEEQTYPSQINLGFYAGDEQTDPYFYSNPWPFEKDQLLDKPLPAGASWTTESFEGSIFPYAELIGDNTAVQRLRDYARTVYDLAAPTL